MFQAYLHWWIAGGILIIGLLGLGLQDTRRLSLARVWAISGVCSAESIRRRVLWLTPLTILAILAVSQFQRPVDQLDAIRQTIKICLFATGMLVTLVSIILACTNLPKEIDNRVIYTIVTKPASRLEIVLGKILGFARVSAVILLIMGLFSLTYLHFRAWELRQNVLSLLQTPGQVDPVLQPTLEHYRDAGLLASKRLASPDNLSFFARPPQPDNWWFSGEAEQEVLVPFDISTQDFTPPGPDNLTPGSTGLVVLLNLDCQQHLSPEELAKLPDEEPDAPLAAGPMLPASAKPAAKKLPTPQIIVQILDQNRRLVVPASQINGGKPISLPPAIPTAPPKP